MQYIEQSALSLLHYVKLPIATAYFKKLITTHPDYPALTSATDSLELLGIPYNAIQADKENLQELRFPLLAHTYNNGGELQLIKSLQELTPSFKENWSGVTIMINSNTFTNNKENILAYKKEQKQKKQYTVLALAIVSLMLFPFLFHFISYGITPLIQCILSIVGIGLGVLIYQQEQGINNAITETLCKKTEDCNAITNSKAATIIWGIKWSDIGIVYFTTITLLLCISAFTIGLSYLLNVLSLISLLSVPFTLYSLYYQKYIAKKWCTLCLYTLAILWLQVLEYAVNYFTYGLPTLDYVSLLKVGFVTIIALSFIAAVWLLLLKQLLQTQLKSKQQINALKRFKHNPASFINNLIASDYINVPVQQNDLQLANPNAAVQIVVACNPYCGPCVDAHFQLTDMLTYTKENIGLTIHFMANHTPNESNRSKAINAIYNCLEANAAIGNAHKIDAILHNWFTTNDVTKFNILNKENGLLINEENEISRLQKSDISRWEKQIEYTPTILINGYKLPAKYTIQDFITMILPLINEDYFIEKTITKTA
jgi:uncharacterized membrane protein